MYCHAQRHNAIAYLLWRRLLRNHGPFAAWLDAFFFGPSRGMNDYDLLAASYKESNIKPDKLYSILPTVLQMVGNCTGKVVTDIGCGAGFFTRPLADLGATCVYGLDNSEAQIELARNVSPHSAITYRVCDAFVDPLPPSDVIVAPFVLNYARTVPILRHFMRKQCECLPQNGKAVFVIDLPNGKSLKRFGAVKTLVGSNVDETEIRIDLFRDEIMICTLTAVYFTPMTVERLLREVGFRDVHRQRPFVSSEGIRALGAKFWQGYTADPELGYLIAEK